MAAYKAASMALDLEERSRIKDMADRDDESNTEHIQQHLFQVFPPVGIRPLVQADAVNPNLFTDKDTSPSKLFSHLVSLCSKHETVFAKKVDRVGCALEAEATTINANIDSNNATIPATSAACSLLINKFDTKARWETLQKEPKFPKDELMR
ncbi:hypothetical protein FRC12_014808 [Ceratobasidium sp. 428]|nr:hypothetical protein FRC12_014808 [Ceratobasidium sp. 428]